MRSNLRVGFVALVAVFALSAVAAASALASPEWYVKKGGSFKKVSAAVNVDFTGTYELYYHPSILETYHFSCTVGSSSTLISGAIEAASLGSITKFSLEEPETQCKGVKETRNICERVELEKAGELPWSTELYSEGTEKRIRIKSGGSLPPVTEWKCGRGNLKCNLNTTAKVTNFGLLNVVEARFDANSNKVECNNRGKAEGEWKGTLTIAPTEGEKKAGVEGIKVE